MGKGFSFVFRSLERQGLSSVFYRDCVEGRVLVSVAEGRRTHADSALCL